MKSKIIPIIVLEFIFLQAFAQQYYLINDYMIFGRKEPASLGSLFGSLGTGTILLNPANVALTTDNRISSGGTASSIGLGYFISWMAPNLSISSARQELEVGEENEFYHAKRFLHFNFGISSQDFGFGGSDRELAVGIAVVRQADRLTDHEHYTIFEHKNVTSDLGMTLRWKPVSVEVAVLNLNNAKLKILGKEYGRRRFVFGGRFSTPAGLTLALQGITGESYAGSDFGLSLGAEQTFFEHRLITRLQLTSFFLGPEATMQNISSCIGYRLSPRTSLPSLLTDVEFCYAMGFLSMPKNIGTHMIVLSKYF